MPVRELTIKNFPYGLIDSVEDKSIPRGASSISKNFITNGDSIEMRRGQARVGATEIVNNVPITGLGKAIRLDGIETTIRKRARKIEYYDSVTDDWIEIGTDIIPVEAESDYVTIEPYIGITGAAVFINSPNMTGPIKIMSANIGDYINLAHTTNFGGWIKIRNNRTVLWNRGRYSGAFVQFDKTGYYGSYIDKDEASDFTQIAAEAIGSSGSLSYSGTLAFKGAGARRNCFEVTFTDGTETFTDDGNGALVGNQGGTGTINYTTGAYSITFNAVAAGSVTATYRWEDSAVNGIADFSKSAPRTAGQGFIFRQDDTGKPFKNVFSIGGTEYCFHEKGVWANTLSLDDTEATNLIYRINIGMPSLWAGDETGEGIYFVDDSEENGTHFRVLEYNVDGTQVLPKSISKAWKLESLNVKAGINLTDYRFENAVVKKFGEYILFACRHKDSDRNDTLFVYDRTTRNLNRLSGYFVSTMEIVNGSLLAGDALSSNVYTLFSGLADEESPIDAEWVSGDDNLDIPDRLKRVKKCVAKGLIGIEQTAKVYMSLDRDAFVEVGEIDGSGNYVDRSSPVTVGALTLGRGEIGGGGDGINAYNYVYEFSLRLGKFERVRIRIVPQAVGYFSLSEFSFKDIRVKERKIARKYRL